MAVFKKLFPAYQVYINMYQHIPWRFLVHHLLYGHNRIDDRHLLHNRYLRDKMMLCGLLLPWSDPSFSWLIKCWGIGICVPLNHVEELRLNGYHRNSSRTIVQPIPEEIIINKVFHWVIMCMTCMPFPLVSSRFWQKISCSSIPYSCLKTKLHTVLYLSIILILTEKRKSLRVLYGSQYCWLYHSVK